MLCLSVSKASRLTFLTLNSELRTVNGERLQPCGARRPAQRANPNKTYLRAVKPPLLPETFSFSFSFSFSNFLPIRQQSFSGSPDGGGVHASPRLRRSFAPPGPSASVPRFSFLK